MEGLVHHSDIMNMPWNKQHNIWGLLCFCQLLFFGFLIGFLSLTCSLFFSSFFPLALWILWALATVSSLVAQENLIQKRNIVQWDYNLTSRGHTLQVRSAGLTRSSENDQVLQKGSVLRLFLLSLTWLLFLVLGIFLFLLWCSFFSFLLFLRCLCLFAFLAWGEQKTKETWPSHLGRWALVDAGSGMEK